MLTFRLGSPRSKPIPSDVVVTGLVDRDDPSRPSITVDWTESERQAYLAAKSLEACRIDFKSFEDASRIAEAANRDLANGERRFIPTDSGPNCHPRYDVIETWKLGEPVSYSFNGDTYPDGEIVKIGTGTMEWITTSTGSRYHRQGLSGRWRKQGGTWSLVHGHIFEQNPHF